MNVSTLAKSKDPIFNKCMLFLMTDSSTSVMTQTGSLPGIDSLLDVLVSQLFICRVLDHGLVDSTHRLIQHSVNESSIN